MALKIRNSIFYHIPKTGGYWVEKAVSILRIGKGEERYLKGTKHSEFPFGLVRKHIIPNDITEEDKKGLFSFCFVRHPIDWYKSFWSFRMDREGGSMTRKADVYKKFIIDGCWNNDFEKFIANVIERVPEGFVSQLYQYYVRDVSFVGRQENLREDFIAALELAGEDFDKDAIRDFKRYNTSSNRENKLRLSKSLEKRLLKVENWVISNFYK